MMRRLFTVFSIASLLTISLPAVAQSAVYPTTFTSVSNQIYQPNNALGAPDDQYATFFSGGADIILDFGQDVSGDLTVTYQLLQFGAQYQVDFLNTAGNTLAMGGGTFNLGTSVVVPYHGDSSYRAVRITDTQGQNWKLDAVSATAVNPTPVPVPVPVSTPAPTPIVQGSLVKLSDDGDPVTTYDTAVYEIDASGYRHAFPSESVFFSWYVDFSSVQVLSAEKLASYQLGKNVTMRPGTKLIKLMSDPRVYAVYADATLRWISSESVALTLFGLDWHTKVIDISDVFFGNYKTGNAILPSDSAPTLDTKNPYPY